MQLINNETVFIHGTGEVVYLDKWGGYDVKLGKVGSRDFTNHCSLSGISQSCKTRHVSSRLSDNTMVWYQRKK